MRAVKQPAATHSKPIQPMLSTTSSPSEMRIPFVPSLLTNRNPRTPERVRIIPSFFLSPDLTTVTFSTSGKPVITQLTKQRSDDGQYKVLTCQADAVPEPTFQWSVNNTGVSVAAAASARTRHGKCSTLPGIKGRGPHRGLRLCSGHPPRCPGWLLVGSLCTGCIAAGKQLCVSAALMVNTLVVAARSDKYGN